MFNKISLKEAVIEAIRELPDDCSIEDIIREIQSMGSLVDNFRAVEMGQFLTEDELLKQIKRKGN
jgi:hypothetical protein